MPASCSRHPAAITTSASWGRSPCSRTISGSTPRRCSRRNRRRAMFTTIWMWIHEWSDIPRRFAFACATYHHAFSCSSALAASRNFSSARLPRVGTLMRIGSIASRSTAECGGGIPPQSIGTVGGAGSPNFCNRRARGACGLRRFAGGGLPARSAELGGAARLRRCERVGMVAARLLARQVLLERHREVPRALGDVEDLRHRRLLLDLLLEKPLHELLAEVVALVTRDR